MKYPVCGNDMESGYVQANQYAAWVKKPNKIMYAPKKGDIQFISRTPFSVPSVPADICKKCRKILVDY